MIIRADARHIPIVDESVQCVITSPPYWGLRDYGVEDQIGFEPTPDAYVATMIEVFREIRRVLKNDGTVWLNLGDSYAGGGNGGGGSFAKDGIRRAEKGTDKNQRPWWKKGRTQIANGLKPKDLCGIPWRVAFALQGFAVVPFRAFSMWADELLRAREAQDWEAVEIVEGKLRRMDLLASLQSDGWYLRSDIVWAKPNPMPESVTDRPTRSHEYIFLLTKSARYYYDALAIAEPLMRPDEGLRKTPARFGGADKYVEARKQSRLHSGNEYRGTSTGTRNKRDVWTVNSEPTPEAHFATFPQKLIEPCILAGSRMGDVCFDPFLGSGTVGKVCGRLGRRWVGLELSADYIEIAQRRTAQQGLRLLGAAK